MSNDVNITLGQGGLGRQLPNDDHVSALLFAQAQPGDYGSDKMRSYRSLLQVEQDGIVETDPNFGIVHYHAKEFFRMHPEGELFLIFNLMVASTIRSNSQGRIRQFGVMDTIANIGTYQQLAEDLRDLKAPAVVVLGATGITDVTDTDETPDLHLQENDLVSVLIAGDGGNDGNTLAASLGLSYIPAVGAVLGALSSAAVNESIGWVGEFNFADVELETIKLADGTQYTAILEADLEQLDERGYIFLKKFVGSAGSYVNDTYTATVLTSDYSQLENNRTIQKASRLLYNAYLPQLNSPLLVDPDDGTLAITTVSYFESLGNISLRENMLNQGELSGFEVSINPDQNVLTTSTLEINVRLVPVGVARNIDITLGFAVSL